MADKNNRRQGKRVLYDILNNLSSVDLFYEEKKEEKKTSSKKILGIYQAEWLKAAQDADVSKTVLHWTFCEFGAWILCQALVSEELETSI